MPGCANNAQTGGAVGALAGAGVGQAVGRNPGSTLAGAAIGGVSGYIVGNEMDKKQTQREMAQIREQQQYVMANFHNSNGSISQVRLYRQGVGYVGPRGEYYQNLPTEEQLRPVYGF